MRIEDRRIDSLTNISNMTNDSNDKHGSFLCDARRYVDDHGNHAVHICPSARAYKTNLLI